MLGKPPSPAACTSASEEGVYVIGFSYPVVPKGQARIRAQIPAQRAQLE
jgi:7-keto-8-aminopelargonate synthetase-like enzyme